MAKRRQADEVSVAQFIAAGNDEMGNGEYLAAQLAGLLTGSGFGWWKEWDPFTFVLFGILCAAGLGMLFSICRAIVFDKNATVSDPKAIRELRWRRVFYLAPRTALMMLVGFLLYTKNQDPTGISYSPSKSRIEEKRTDDYPWITAADLKKDEIRDRTVFLPDFARTPELIAGKKFRNCQIWGPGLLRPGPGSRIGQSTANADFFTIIGDMQKKIVGVMPGAIDVQDCEVHDIGMMGYQAEVNEWMKQIRVQGERPLIPGE